MTLLVFFRWWGVTLRAPLVLLWSAVFTAVLVLIELATGGPTALRARGGLRRRIIAWMALVVLAVPGFAIFPPIRIGTAVAQPVVFSGTLDVVVPLWIAAYGVSRLWSGWWLVLWGGVLATSLGVAFWCFVVRMPGRPFTGPLPPLSPEQLGLRDALERHVRVLAQEIGERNRGRYQALEHAADYLEHTLAGFGYEVVPQVYRVGNQAFRNLEVTIRGAATPDRIVVVGAHYDTVDGAPGADDNASGVAAVLELARRAIAWHPACTLKLVLFVNEEPPFFDTDGMGSRVYAREAARRGDRIVAMVSLETIAYYSEEAGSQHYPPPFAFFYPGRGDFVGFVGNLGSAGLLRRAVRTFRRHTRFPSQGAAAPTMIPGITWSDHASFWRYGYPAIMISDTAPFRNPYYHTSLDGVETLDFDRMARAVEGVVLVVKDLVGIDVDAGS